MGSTKILKFIGSNKQEILLYLGGYMNLLDLRCVVIDATLEQNLKYVIPVVIEDSLITYRGVDYIINVKCFEDYERLDLSIYDVIIVDYGFNMDFINQVDQYRELFLVTDFMKYNIEKIRCILKALNDDTKFIKIYKDILPSKISKRYIDRKLGLDKKDKVLEEYIFELDEKSYISLLNIQYNDKFNLNRIDKSYHDFCQDVVEEKFGVKLPSIKKLIKQRGRGKKNASSVLEYSSWAVGDNN